MSKNKTRHEIASITCNESTPTEDLLLVIHNSLTNGALMTKGNIAFHYLCERLGFNSFDFDDDEEP